MRTIIMVTAIAAGVLTSGAAIAQTSPQPAPRIERPRDIPNPYTAYDFLIGDWYSKPSGGQDVSIHQNFRWGPKKSYIFYTTLTSLRGEPEAVHFEGMAVWNGKTKQLDYIVTSEPGSGAQEQGTMRAEADGSIVREVLLTRADGQTGHFRQRFWRTGNDTVTTSLMRQTTKGWEPNFPGSEQILMTRRPG
jgi:hypothetical protein